MKRRQPKPLGSAKCEILRKRYANVIHETRKQLAMNFDIPSRDIIAMACHEIGIQPEQWSELARTEQD